MNFFPIFLTSIIKTMSDFVSNHHSNTTEIHGRREVLAVENGLKDSSREDWKLFFLIIEIREQIIDF